MGKLNQPNSSSEPQCFGVAKGLSEATHAHRTGLLLARDDLRLHPEPAIQVDGYLEPVGERRSLGVHLEPRKVRIRRARSRQLCRRGVEVSERMVHARRVRIA